MAKTPITRDQWIEFTRILLDEVEECGECDCGRSACMDLFLRKAASLAVQSAEVGPAATFALLLYHSRSLPEVGWISAAHALIKSEIGLNLNREAERAVNARPMSIEDGSAAAPYRLEDGELARAILAIDDDPDTPAAAILTGTARSLLEIGDPDTALVLLLLRHADTDDSARANLLNTLAQAPINTDLITRALRSIHDPGRN